MPLPFDGGTAGLDWQPPKTSHKPNRRTPPRDQGAPCCVPRCPGKISRRKTWGYLCDRHGIANRRWGHPQQTALKVRDLDPYLQVVKRVRERSKGTDWSAVYARWRAVVAVAREYLDQVRKGHAHVGYRRQAADIVTQLADNMEEARAVDLVMAVYLLEEFEPRRFHSDEAFRTCLLHILRKEAKVGRRFNLKVGGREKASYRILGQKVREEAAKWAIEGLGLVGLHVDRQERARVNAQDSLNTAYRDAVASIG